MEEGQGVSRVSLEGGRLSPPPNPPPSRRRAFDANSADLAFLSFFAGAFLAAGFLASGSFLAAAFLAGAFFFGAAPALAASKGRAAPIVMSSGAVPLGRVALILPDLT